MKTLKQLFCWHRYDLVSKRIGLDSKSFINGVKSKQTYSVYETTKCSKCNKTLILGEKWDGSPLTEKCVAAGISKTKANGLCNIKK